MNRDFFSGPFMQLTELQPVHPHHQFDYALASAATTSSHEMTAGDAAGALAAASLHPAPLHSQHDPRKRRSSAYASDGSYEAMAGCDPALAATMPAPAARKRKYSSSIGTASAYEDDGEDGRSTRTLPDKRQNHSEIEKRRRDKMNAYITELSGMVPMCGAMARKLDKLTVLRMAVQHLRSVRGALSACPLAARPRPAFVTERELNELILHAAAGAFVLVVGCDRGRLLYVSASAEPALHYEKSELLGQSLFDILHPKDVAKVKEQLSSSDLSPRERLIDAKTMLPVKTEVGAAASRLCPGARRSFFCRIKCKASALAPLPVKEELDPASANLRKKHHEKKYCVVQCTGYLKSWAPAEMCESGAEGGEEDACNLSCLVAVGRALPDLAPAPRAPPAAPPTRRLQFTSRHAIDGKYLFVDQRVTLALGFLPQELLGTSLYEYVAAAELGAVARAHKAALTRRGAVHTPPYAARTKDGDHALLQTHFKPFKNPWTKDVECLMAQNTLVSEAPAAASAAADAALAFDELEKGDGEVQRLIEAQVETHKIGSAIAEEALRRSPAPFSPELPADLLQDVIFNQVYDLENVDLTLFEEQSNGMESAAPRDAMPPLIAPCNATPRDMTPVAPYDAMPLTPAAPRHAAPPRTHATQDNNQTQSHVSDPQCNEYSSVPVSKTSADIVAVRGKIAVGDNLRAAASTPDNYLIVRLPRTAPAASQLVAPKYQLSSLNVPV